MRRSGADFSFAQSNTCVSIRRMSVEQIEEQIRRLKSPDLGRLTKWFGQYLAERGTNSDWQESAEQIRELERRLAEFEADPAMAAPFEPNYFNDLKKKLTDDPAKKTSAG
jgi:ribosomal protein L29